MTTRIATIMALLLFANIAFAQSQEFGDIVVRYSAVSTNALPDDTAKSYGIERSSRNGLLNIAVQRKRDGADAELIGAKIAGSVSDLTGHAHAITFRETREGGDIDYLGEFPVESSGAYLFTIRVAPIGTDQSYTLKFNQNYVVD